ncbi:MAG: hypothetical protein KAT90_01630 [Gammaproteobacteria bacterium]|nr:hypothetical protein [Gammaproteobacteria bacterium]
MKLLCNVGFVLVCQCLFLQPGQAEESLAFDAFPRAGMGLNQLAYVRADGTQLDANYTTLNLGLTVNYEQFYFDMGGELFGVDFLENQGEITGIERQDYTFTAGYLPTQAVSVFLGYTVGEMKDDFQGEFHDDRGHFLGVGYSYLNNTTNFTVTLAYADLDGSITVDGVPADNTKGQTRGFSYGFTVSGPFRETMAYSIALKIRQYDYEVSGRNEVTDKEITSLTLGLIF